MALSKETLIIALDYWRIQKTNMMEEFTDLVEDSIDNPEETDIKQIQKISQEMDDVELVISRIEKLLIKY